MRRRYVLDGHLPLVTAALSAALVAAQDAVHTFGARLVECRVLNPEEPQVHEAPTPKRGHERFRMERRNTAMKMRSRR